MWDGTERRRKERFCEGHLSLCEDMAIVKTTVLALDKRINGTIGQVEKHIENSRPRNIAIGGAIVTICLVIFSLAISLGESKQMLKINTERWDKLLTKITVIDTIK